ncbi:MAG: hypothetical protein IKX40_05115 [Thermoguttaceae bacterium]|nr:hypothetical protein [Thermoguttaceae bacterium]
MLSSVSVFAQIARPLIPQATPKTPAARPMAATPQAAPAPAPTASSGQKYVLKSGRKAGSMDKVTYQQIIQGKLMVPSAENSDKLPPGAAKPEKATVKTANGSTVEMDVYPVKAQTKLQYNEKTIQCAEEDNSFSIQAIRNYQSVNVQRTVNGEDDSIALPEEKMMLNVDVEGADVIFFHKKYCMNQDELDALEVMAPSLALETLLPTEPVAIGDTWSITEDSLGALLQLDLLSQAQVEQVLTDVKGTTAIIDVQGRAAGEIDGVSTTINFKLKYYYSLKINRIIWAGMVTNEERQSGPITPDLAIETQVQMTIVPAAPAEDAKLAAEQWTEPTDELLLIHYISLDGDWTMFHDRRWCIFRNEPNQVIFRFMHQGEYIAQCVINKTSNPETMKNMTLAEFKKQVEEAVMEDGEKTRSIIAANEEMSPSNVNVFQVVATDSADNTQWGYYMLKGAKASQQLVFMFTLDGENSEAVGETDMQMIGTLEFKK